jgi:16S rRNA processing protein RimM
VIPPADDLVTVGTVGRPHGLKGAVFVEGASEDPTRFALGARLLVDGQEAKVVESKHGAGGRPVVRFDRPVARGALLQLPRSELPEPAEGAFYVFQLVGLPVEEEGGRRLGVVQEVLPGLANDLLELDTGVLLPLIEDCVLEVDLARSRIRVARGFAETE